MPDLYEQRGVLVSTIVAAVLGAVLAALLIFGEPAIVFDWMRVRKVIGGNPSPAPSEVALFIAFAATLLAIVTHAIHSVLRRLGISRPATALAVVMIVVFAIAFAAEATHQLTRASGYRTAWDAVGPMIEDRRLTPHGWETIGRRAAVASLFSGIVAAAFSLARLAGLAGFSASLPKPRNP